MSIEGILKDHYITQNTSGDAEYSVTMLVQLKSKKLATVTSELDNELDRSLIGAGKEAPSKQVVKFFPGEGREVVHLYDQKYRFISGLAGTFTEGREAFDAGKSNEVVESAPVKVELPIVPQPAAQLEPEPLPPVVTPTVTKAEMDIEEGVVPPAVSTDTPSTETPTA